jgi:hypothetical protein
MTFIFDVTKFDESKSELVTRINKINFLGVKDIDETITFINIRNAKAVIVKKDQIEIDYEDYFYVIAPGKIEEQRYIKI